MAENSVDNMSLLERKDMPEKPSLNFAGSYHQANFLQIDLIRSEENGNQIKIAYRENQKEVLPFSTDKEKLIAIGVLKQDAIAKYL